MLKKLTLCVWASVKISSLVNATGPEDVEVLEEKSPVGSEFYLSQSLGAGTFFKNYQQRPYVATNLYAYPYYQYGPFLGEREVKIHAELRAEFEWMGENNAFKGKFADKLDFGDLKIRAELKKALYGLGLSFSPAFKVEIPLSKSSRSANRVLGLGGFFTVAWSNYGFFLTYKPVALGYIHSTRYKSGECGGDSSADDRLDNGKCKVEGRQGVALLKNTVSAGYKYGSHKFTLAFRTYHSFLRPIDQSERPEKEPKSDLLLQTLAFAEYAYDLPLSVPTTVILGISGEQSYYDSRLGFRMPFFDFSDPKKNLTEAYVALNVAM